MREDHEPATVASHGEWNNEMVAIDLATGTVSVLISGADFYAAPRLSPDGSTLAWLEWHHPNMPWDGTELKVAPIGADGSLGDARRRRQPRRLDLAAALVAGRDPALRGGARLDEPVPRGRRYGRDGDGFEAEFVGPDWVFGLVSFAFMADGGILAVARSAGRDQLVKVDPTVVSRPSTRPSPRSPGSRSMATGSSSGPRRPIVQTP